MPKTNTQVIASSYRTRKRKRSAKAVAKVPNGVPMNESAKKDKKVSKRKAKAVKAKLVVATAADTARYNAILDRQAVCDHDERDTRMDNTLGHMITECAQCGKRMPDKVFTDAPKDVEQVTRAMTETKAVPKVKTKAKAATASAAAAPVSRKATAADFKAATEGAASHGGPLDHTDFQAKWGCKPEFIGWEANRLQEAQEEKDRYSHKHGKAKNKTHKERLAEIDNEAAEEIKEIAIDRVRVRNGLAAAAAAAAE